MTQDSIVEKCKMVPDTASLSRRDSGRGSGEVFSVTPPESGRPQYIVKVVQSQTKHKTVETIRNALSAYGVPLPETVETKQSADESYIVTRVIPNEYFRWDDPEAVINFLYQCADILFEFHDASFDGLRDYFARKNPDRVPEDFTEWRLKKHISRLEDTSLYESDVQEVEQVHQWFKKNTDVTRTVIHGDLHLPNILTSVDGDVKAIVDWEKTRVGDPAYDLAKFECRTIDLYEPCTQFSHQLLRNLFRTLYGYTASLTRRVDAHKHAYALQFRATLEKHGAFEDWKIAEQMNGEPFSVDCIERYEHLLDYYRKQSPVQIE